jgi:hypothetical protein
MPTSNRSVYLRWSTSNGVTSRTAVYGPVRTVVWQGSVSDRRPYADQRPLSFIIWVGKPKGLDQSFVRVARDPLGAGKRQATLREYSALSMPSPALVRDDGSDQ